MSFLSGIAIRKQILEERITITSLDPKYPFEPDQQTTEDAIDLRLSPFALKYRADVQQVDYLKDDLSSLFESITLSSDEGFELRSGDTIFSQTLEAISLPDDLIGLVVTLGAPKFPPGMSWAFPLQITNQSPVSVVLYPYSIIAQLLVSSVHGPAVGYQGRYQYTYTPSAPVFNDRERKFMKDLTLDVRTRTLHILKKEVEQQREHILRDAKRNRQLTVSKSTGTVEKPRNAPLPVVILKVLAALSGTTCVGIGTNLLTSDQNETWKTVSAILFMVLGAVLVLWSVFTQTPGRETSV
jgi:deoxycytidine triphosphate deaminase